MVHLVVEGVVNSLPESSQGKSVFANITFMGGRINVQVPEHLLSSLRPRLGTLSVFYLDCYARPFPRTTKDGSTYFEMSFAPGKVLEVRDKK